MNNAKTKSDFYRYYWSAIDLEYFDDSDTKPMTQTTDTFCFSPISAIFFVSPFTNQDINTLPELLRDAKDTHD